MKLLSKLDSLDNVQDGSTRKLITKTTSSGNGNAVTSVSVSGDTITYTKGTSFLTSHQSAFSNVKVGSSTVAANQAGDTLELVAGSNVTLTPDTTNDKVTIAATDTDTTYSLTADTTNNKVVLTPSSGTAQSITVPYATKALNDKNGNDIVDTYVQNSNYYLNTHPENTPVVIPFIHNDISFLKVRGGSYIVEYDGATQSQNIDSVFDGSPSYWAINPTGVTTITITLTLHKVFAWSNTVYFDFGSSGWRSKNIKIEAMNSNFADDVWSTKLDRTDNTKGNGKVTFSHTPVGASSASGGFNKLRFTFSSWNSSTIFRIAQLGIYNYGSLGVRETFMSRGIDDEVMRNITPVTNNVYNLGSSSKKWANVYATTFNGQLSGSISSSTTATTQSAGDNSTKIATTAYVDSAITALPEPMIFKGSLGTGGTITTLPAASSSNEGFTYKVITAGTYASQAAKVGDTFISDGSAWILIPSGDEPSGTVTSIKIQATSPIAIDSDTAITTSGTRTLSHANSGVTAGTYRSVTVNATGHVTAGTNPTTLSGYGITDAKIASGVITLGSNTITPLTASSTLDATKLSGTIPSGCYTDTKNTAGSTDTSSKIYLIGATSQAANPQTYSDNEVYATSGVLTTKSVQVGGTAATMQYNSTDKCIEFVFA